MKGRITAPSSGSKIISTRIRVEGLLTDLDTKRKVWIAHRRIADGILWPKEPSIQPRSDGSFSIIAHEGGSPGDLIISLIAVDNRADQAFREWLKQEHKTGRSPGLSPKKFTLDELDRVNVVYAPSPPKKAFISYSHRDAEFLMPLHDALSTLKRAGKIEAWDDRLIPAGAEVSGEIEHQLAQADLMLPLVSSSFISSDYCYHHEMTNALQRHRIGAMHVVPVIVRPCDWKSTSLGQLKALPKDGRPVTTWSNRDEAWLDVTLELSQLLSNL